MYKHILIDLDGTIVDSGLGIINSVIYALNKYGIEVPDRTPIRRFIGPPLKNSFMEFYGFSESDAELAVKYYREYYADKGIFECEVYDGIPKLLADLNAAGKDIILATSKPEFYANQILEHFGLSSYFKYTAGLKMNDLSSQKADIIAHGLMECGITDMSEVIMIGDRKHDIIGAHAHNISCIAVMFGYGSMEEFKEYGADFIAENTDMVFDICTR